MVTNGATMESVEEVKREVFHHFANKFMEEVPCRPELEGAIFKSLSSIERDYIESIFVEEEGNEAIWNCDGSKSLGPDDYSILFEKKCWTFIKNDIMSCFGDFHLEVVLSKLVTSTFLTLIPEKDNPLDLDDYRPICLVGCIYKIILKVLAGRLKKVIRGIISSSQSAFVPGRQILDGVVIANKLVDYANKKKNGSLLFKV